jgi:ankyrin repeat protein
MVTSTSSVCWSRRGHFDVVRALVDAHANVDHASTTDGTTPLCIAAQKGHVEVVRVLIDAHADINQANRDGTTPLSAAKSLKHHDIVEVLLVNRARVR